MTDKTLLLSFFIPSRLIFYSLTLSLFERKARSHLSFRVSGDHVLNVQENTWMVEKVSVCWKGTDVRARPHMALANGLE